MLSHVRESLSKLSSTPGYSDYFLQYIMDMQDQNIQDEIHSLKFPNKNFVLAIQSEINRLCEEIITND